MKASTLFSPFEYILTWVFYPQVIFLLYSPTCSYAYDLVYAINCGGPKHVDRFGIQYDADSNDVGISSNFGQSLAISRVHPDDRILYQTERYHTSSFSYNVPIDEDGEYILVTKYSEVYFQYANGKVFDVVLNKKHIIVSDLDIFAKVGIAAAHDEVTRFVIDSGRLVVNGEDSSFHGTLSIEFAKGKHDNPKVNAIVLLKGPIRDSEIPALAPPEVQGQMSEGDFEMEEEASEVELKFRRTSGPKMTDPYASDDSWFMPITIAVAVFLPVLFCLCRVR